MANLPIFRAKNIDSDQYIIGYLKFDRKHNHYSINPIDDENTWHKIEENTLAIHFPDMLDSQGNKIFASLQENGKGGDKTDSGKVMIFDSIETIPYFESWSNYTVTGIQE